MARTTFSRRQLLAGLGGVLGAAALGPRAAAAAGRTYPDIIGAVRKVAVKKGETLLDIMHRHNVGYVEIVLANPGVDTWIPGEGTEVVLPQRRILPAGPREGIVLNLPEMRLYYFPPNGGPVESFAIGIGAQGWHTPKGRTTVVRKQKNPTWYIPKSILKEDPGRKPVVPPGPDNPLGKHALYLGWPAYLIHGTNMPDAVGRRASHGCINMYPEGVASLFDRVAIGTPVTVVDQLVKFAYDRGELYMQVHVTPRQADEAELSGKFEYEPIPELQYRAAQAAGKDKDRLDWSVIDEAVKRRDGIPVRITQDAAA
jgi:L,D-transpeptidase ErfK/SrfK